MNISISSQIFIVNIYMNIHTTSDRVTAYQGIATHLAWTRKFDENLKQGWTDSDVD